MAVVSETPSLDVNIDPLTLSVIVEMQLEESEGMVSNGRGKQREGTVTDAQLALQIYMEDLRCADAILKDRKLAQSISIAVQRDGNFIYEAYRQEQQAEKDRELALRIATEHAPAAGKETQYSRKMQEKAFEDPWTNAEMLAKVATIYMNPTVWQVPIIRSGGSDAESGQAESSAWAASREEKGKPAPRNCIACGDAKEFEEVARVPCDHEYCRPCLEELFRLSMKDESLFPPRCDNQEIPLDFVRFFLPSSVAKEFEAKYEELSTKNRTYCHDRTCQTFISTALNEEIATCPRCTKTTCIMCKSPSHSGDCPQDAALQQLVETADAHQWQRCYQCARFVELNTGCNHMTCPCGAQFCYVCGARWHACACPQWDEQRLVERATQIVERHPQRRLFQPRRVAHTQPATRPTSSCFHEATVNGPSSSSVVRPRALSTASSAWQSDFSEHSEWQQDWNTEDEDDATVLVEPATDEQTDPVIAPSGGKPVLASPGLDERHNLIAEAIENLRETHNCTHDKWRFVRGRHTCEECRHVLREYIFECRQCQLQACNRCRRNRL
ncbi:Hypothetical predicted protein [Lecanosticta acicola]|uniref:RBR-type E3 ubiquitin transferase n=1 Tax=Lecanosticta acicola TaxID=111012 RepID=A0AAI8W0K8_9PEZI|nr:Hypothetical predicted protein [Lecanosticta acicola]